MGSKFGLTHGLIGSKDDLESEIREIVGERGVDVVIETTGNSRLIEQAYELTHPDGITVCVEVSLRGDNISIYSLPLHFNKRFNGSHGGDSVPDLEIPRFINMIEADKMNLEGLITHEFALEEINEGIDLVRSGKAGES